MRATVSGTAWLRCASAVFSPILFGVDAADLGELTFGGLLLRIGGIVVLGGLAVLIILRFARREEKVRGPIPVPLDGAPPPWQVPARPRSANEAPLPVLLPEEPPPLANQAADPATHPRSDGDIPRAPGQECPITPS